MNMTIVIDRRSQEANFIPMDGLAKPVNLTARTWNDRQNLSISSATKPPQFEW
jgi:hypothetical protein